MNMIGKKVWTLLAVAMICLGSSVAYARSTPSYLGSAQNNGDTACFTNGLGQGSGRVQNVCSGARKFCVALPIASSGGKTVKVNGFAQSSANNVICKAEATNQFGVVVNSSAAIGFNQFGTFGTITLTGASPPSFGGLFVCCDVGTNGQLGNIDYND